MIRENHAWEYQQHGNSNATGTKTPGTLARTNAETPIDDIHYYYHLLTLLLLTLLLLTLLRIPNYHRQRMKPKDPRGPQGVHARLLSPINMTQLLMIIGLVCVCVCVCVCVVLCVWCVCVRMAVLMNVCL